LGAKNVFNGQKGSVTAFLPHIWSYRLYMALF
jgi:hypothetical protein